MLIKEAEYVVFDVETTGLNPQEGDRICQIGAVKVKNSQIVSSFDSLINPKREIPVQAINIHGISSKDVEKAPYIEEVIDSFLEFIRGLPLFGYNIGFDLGFLNSELKILNRETLNNPGVDILTICRRLLNNLPRYSLSYIANFFKIPQEISHRAYQDSFMAAKVFLNLTPYLEEKGISTLENLYTIFGTNKDFSFKINNSKIGIIQKALEENLKLKIKYYSFYKNEFTEREVLPERIENTGRKVFLKAKCLLRGEERRFNLDNITDLKIV